MKLNLKKQAKGLGLSQSKGFTIIEVLIVLAIAGLILLIVFLAVPALQRNSRNTQRKTDVAASIGALTEYANNNGGQLPSDAATFYTSTQNAKNGFYKLPASAVTLNDYDVAFNNTAITAPGPPPVPPSVSKVYVRIGAKCNATNDDVGGAGASSRNIAVVYAVESGGGGNKAVCQES